MAEDSLNQEKRKKSVKRQSLYQEFLAERKELLKHKGIESEKVGHDIGFEQALLNWVRQHRVRWRKTRRRKPKVSRVYENSTPPEEPT